MKWILCSDMHLTGVQPVGRVDDVMNASLAKLYYILKLGEVFKGHVFFAGDLFDKPRDWYLITGVIGGFAKYNLKHVYAVRGQHDMYMRGKDKSRDATTLGVLNSAGFIEILSSTWPRCLGDGVGADWLVYGCDWGVEVPRVEKHDREKLALIVHAPIADKPVYPCQTFTHAEKFIEEHPEWDLVLCGDVHRRFAIRGPDDQLILNTGPGLRLEATEENMEFVPSVAVYDTCSGFLEWQVLPHTPGPEVLSREHLIRAEATEERKAMLAGFVGSLAETKHSNRGATMVDRIKGWLMESNEVEIAKIINEICLGGAIRNLKAPEEEQ